MSIVEEFLGAVTPQETDEERSEARSKARAAAQPGDWLSQILDHHVGLEDAFAEVKAAGESDRRMDALKRLGILVTGHANAEESVIYPGMAEGGEKGHATHAYTEQATVKMQMAKLEQLEPMSDEFMDSVEAIRNAVAHHMYEEEGTWFPDLKQDLPESSQKMMSERYAQEYHRYVGNAGAGDLSAIPMGSPPR